MKYTIFYLAPWIDNQGEDCGGLEELGSSYNMDYSFSNFSFKVYIMLLFSVQLSRYFLHTSVTSYITYTDPSEGSKKNQFSIFHHSTLKAVLNWFFSAHIQLKESCLRM